MTIGSSIGLIIIGAILAFAVSLDVAGVDINVIGFILMIGGLIGLIFGVATWQRGRAVRRTTRIEDDGPPV
jgi:hypothetical protein